MRPIFFVIGWISMGLGFIGAFLPVLPTTPFLILSAYLFSKSSPRFHSWLMNLPMAGPGIRDWQERRVIKPRAKILCTLMITLSALVVGFHPNILLEIKIFVGITLGSVWLFVVTRKST